MEFKKGIYTGYTTSFFALQIAIYLGFRENFYLGLDLGNTAR